MLRPRAETMPAVTEPPRPNGLPMASTQSPGRSFSESPNFTALRGLSGLTRRTARSIFGSLPMISAFSLLPSEKTTEISLASPITWLLVTTMPDGSMTKPEPSELERRWRGVSPCAPGPPPWPPWPRRLKNSSNRSSKGVPGGSCGMVRPRVSTVVEAEMLTTAPTTCSVRSANESGARASAPEGAVATSSKEQATAAASRWPETSEPRAKALTTSGMMFLIICASREASCCRHTAVNRAERRLCQIERSAFVERLLCRVSAAKRISTSPENALEAQAAHDPHDHNSDHRRTDADDAHAVNGRVRTVLHGALHRVGERRKQNAL